MRPHVRLKLTKTILWFALVMAGIWAMALTMPGCAGWAPEVEAAAPDAEALTASAFTATDGTVTVETMLWTSSPSMRGAYTTGQNATVIMFEYLGDTSTLVPLSDGSIRRQVCAQVLKQDPCNVLYACWRTSGLVQVTMKSNPTLHTSDECGDGGYTTVGMFNGPALTSSDKVVHLLGLTLNSAHTTLTTTVDTAAPVQYALPASTAALSSTTFGLRSDNSILHFITVTP